MIKTAVRNAFAVVTVLVLAVMALSFIQADNAYAEDSGYTYRITVYSGSHGTFGGQTVWMKNCNAGEHVRIDLDSLDFKLKNDKYYPRGFRLTGHDNDEVTGAQSMEFDVDCDVAYEVAYGIKGSMVGYTVNYVDSETEEEIHGSDTYYGMPGDKPLVSYRYIEGYDPDTYNITKTLSEDESENIFTFYYKRVNPNTQAGGGTQGGDNGDDGNDAAAPAAPGTPGNPAGTNTPAVPQGQNVDDTPTPTTDSGNNNDGPRQTTDLDPQKTPAAVPVNSTAAVIGTAGLFILLMLIIIALLRKKKKSDGNDVEK